MGRAALGRALIRFALESSVLYALLFAPGHVSTYRSRFTALNLWACLVECSHTYILLSILDMPDIPTGRILTGAPAPLVPQTFASPESFFLAWYMYPFPSPNEGITLHIYSSSRQARLFLLRCRMESYRDRQLINILWSTSHLEPDND
ncbi:hypothetical protein BC827DRAFT_934148 [Russula dissimulans]|nr:hypothetical protein BC827DRAFT_934148 [Russula dissimulans]